MVANKLKSRNPTKSKFTLLQSIVVDLANRYSIYIYIVCIFNKVVGVLLMNVLCH